jgi:hypothetical protein
MFASDKKSIYYPSQLTENNNAFITKVGVVFKVNYQLYGARCLKAALKKQGITVSRRRIWITDAIKYLIVKCAFIYLLGFIDM